MNKKQSNKFLSIVIAFHLALIGCAAKQVTSDWRTQTITADGSESEWPDVPQYYDEDKRTSVRVLNDTDNIYLCFVSNDSELKMNLAKAGLSVWFDPEGEENKVVGIYIPGKGEMFRSSYSKRPKKQGSKPKQSILTMPGTVEMTYSETTGPLKMDIEEIRRTGIEIGVGQPGGSRYVYEVVIPFAIDEVFSEMGTGKAIGVGIMSGNGKSRKSLQDRSMGAMGGNGGGGRSGTKKKPGMDGGFGGGGQSRFERQDTPYEIWLMVRLT